MVVCRVCQRTVGIVTALSMESTNRRRTVRRPASALGSLSQLSGSGGCLVDRSKAGTRCTRVRALRGPAPFLGSHALAISPDGRNVYVASSDSHAIAIFTRNAHTGALSQRPGAAGCIALAGASGCARAVGLANGRNPIAVIVPCHRVIGANGTLVGYGGGLERKRLLLELEQGQGRMRM